LTCNLPRIEAAQSIIIETFAYFPPYFATSISGDFNQTGLIFAAQF